MNDKRIVLGEETEKISNQATGGLSDEMFSLSWRVGVIERHLHSWESWFGIAAVPDGEIHVADHLTLTPFQMDAGNDDFGAWVQIIGSGDTPHFNGNTAYDISALQIVDVQTDATPTIFQIGYGDSGAEALASETVTEKIVTPVRASKQDPYDIRSKVVVAGTKAWIRCWVDGASTSTVDFFYGLHEYEG